jgi:hypothetical protein
VAANPVHKSGGCCPAVVAPQIRQRPLGTGGCCHAVVALQIGFVVNRIKCVPPTTRLTFLGIELDSDAQSEGICRMTIPTAKRERGASLCKDFLARVPETGGFDWASPYLASQWDAIRGFLGHCASVVFDGRLNMRTYITLGISPRADIYPHRGG